MPTRSLVVYGLAPISSRAFRDLPELQDREEAKQPRDCASALFKDCNVCIRM
jgi:hypothetical protein